MNKHRAESEDQSEEDITKEVIKDNKEREEWGEAGSGNFPAKGSKEVDTWFSEFAEIKLSEGEFELREESDHLMRFRKVSGDQFKQRREESE